jgi:hypothetical protein
VTPLLAPVAGVLVLVAAVGDATARGAPSPAPAFCPIALPLRFARLSARLFCPAPWDGPGAFAPGVDLSIADESPVAGVAVAAEEGDAAGVSPVVASAGPAFALSFRRSSRFSWCRSCSSFPGVCGAGVWPMAVAALKIAATRVNENFMRISFGSVACVQAASNLSASRHYTARSPWKAGQYHK